MRKNVIGVLGTILILFVLAAFAVGQTPTQTTTVTKVQTAVQNPDGTYTIVEYPVGKETVVTLNPVGLTGATGTATILRAADGSTIKLNVAGLPAELTTMNIYAIDPAGKVTLLGPVTIANNAGAVTTATPLTKFMLVASPDANLSAYNETTTVFFRSAAPEGLAIIPLSAPVGEKVAAIAAPVTAPVVTAPVTSVVAPITEIMAPVTSDYTVPMLGIPSFKKGDDTKLKVNFTGAMEGARANIFIEPHKNGKTTEVRMRFHDLKEAPKGQVYVLWAVSPDNNFTQLGQVVNVKGRNEAEIKSEVPHPDFGLFLTVEDLNTTKATITTPSGQRVGVIEIIR